MFNQHGRGGAAAPSLSRRERRRKPKGQRGITRGFAACVWRPERGDFQLIIEDWRTGRNVTAFITPHQAAGLGMSIAQVLQELEGLRDAAVPGSGKPS